MVVGFRNCQKPRPSVHTLCGVSGSHVNATGRSSANAESLSANLSAISLVPLRNCALENWSLVDDVLVT